MPNPNGGLFLAPVMAGCPSFRGTDKPVALVEIEDIEVLEGTFVAALEQECTGTDDSGEYENIQCPMPRFSTFCSNTAGKGEGSATMLASMATGPYCYCRINEFMNRTAREPIWIAIANATATTKQSHVAYSNLLTCQAGCTRQCYNRLTQVNALFYQFFQTFMQYSVG